MRHQSYNTSKDAKVEEIVLHEKAEKKAKKPVKKAAKAVKKDKPETKKEMKKRLWPTDMAFYLSIWDKRPHVCYNCNAELGNKPLTLYFDHILEKGTEKYEHLRHVEENICLLCWDCHTNKALIPKLTQLKEDTIKLLIDEKVADKTEVTSTLPLDPL